ncbi:MAG: hypothetical protein ACKVRP_00620 [Bacteroidota bacterium]
MKSYLLQVILICTLSLSCSRGPTVDEIAESFVKLGLALGEHDADYVDAYHGPKEWRDEAKAQKKSLEEILLSANELRTTLFKKAPGSDEMDKLRYTHLTKMLAALIGRTEILLGRNLDFDEEAEVLYDAAPPAFPESHFQQIIAELDREIPGAGTVLERYETYRSAFIIPKEKLDTVFKAAIAECRRRTLQHIALPENESFNLEYVNNKSWSGYNWYQGNSRSLIQINTDLPIYIERAVDLGAHEGYPGHHLYNLLHEQHLLKERGWIEFSIFPLFAPTGLIAEGSGNYGIEVAFTPDERLRFEQEVLFPLAGLDPAGAVKYYRIQELVAKLSYAGNEAARRFLNKVIEREEAVRWLMDYSLMSQQRAEQRVKFIEQYRSYVINYNLGQDMVKRYIESRGGTSGNTEKRWTEFKRLLSMPLLPSDIAVKAEGFEE